MVQLNIRRFINACDPSQTIDMSDRLQSRYYIDISSVRGGELIKEMERKITRSDKYTCQLFTGHIGCGKSTELLYLQKRLTEQNFHVIYIQADSEDSNIDLGNISTTDILLLIARRVIKDQKDNGFNVISQFFQQIIHEAGELLKTPMDFGGELSLGLLKLTAKTKENHNRNPRLRAYLEKNTNNIVEAINNDILKETNERIKKQGKNGLVVIVDDLDRVNYTTNAAGRSQAERLFVDGGEKLRQLNCHKIYTIPLYLSYSNEGTVVRQRMVGGLPPTSIPMIRVQSRNGGGSDKQGIYCLTKMVLARAFPEYDIPEDQRLPGKLLEQIFDDPKTLNRLCHISGGHVRNFLGNISSCLHKKDPPISTECLERVIQDNRDNMIISITDDEWDLLFRVDKTKMVQGEKECEILLRSLFVFEYHDSQGRWFEVNPLLKEAEKFKTWQQQQI